MFDFLLSPITLYPWFIIGIAIFYTLINIRFQQHFLLRWIHIIPTLLHEFGHALFCQLTGGKVEDIIIVTSRYERKTTGRAGYAVTRTKHAFNQFMTMIGGYLFPPMMLLTGILSLQYHQPVIFWLTLIMIFTYYFIKTSRKWLPLIVLIVLGTFMYFMMANPQYQYTLLNDIIYQLILAVLLADTILTSFTISALYFHDRNQTWDGALLGQMTRLPVFIYYLLFLSAHLAALYAAVQLLI
ncbi:M50 family metallopeptidase [Macrococcus brunensis]|uniref:M50 family metallopeptidase n=1 Tax=Macrococcus brunensis TaxID=198483 RepID=UPI001EF07798|nr:M50 family metallopeptidase [Macrococcus brunensis]ULG72111.1 M50 family metallopeptidase [Macrococcus brunensis]ULG74363.1 M50 family metallopeptidase [Macrococcus brunensis]